MGLGTYAKGVWNAITNRAATSALSHANWGGATAGRDWLAGRRPSPAALLNAYRGVLFTCANLNAVGVSRVPLRLYATTARGQARPRCLHRSVQPATVKRLRRDPLIARAMAGAERVDEVLEHPLLDALDNPCPEFDREQLVDFLCRELDMLGRAYLRPVDGDWGPPAELWPLPAQDVEPIRRTNVATIEGYRYFGEEIKPDRLIRFRWVNLKDPYGEHYSPAEAAFAYSGLEDKYVRIRDQVLGLGPRPSMLFVADGRSAIPPGEPERLRFEADINRKFAPGGEGHARAMVTSGAYKPVPITYPPDGLGGEEVPLYTLERMANCFGTPISMFTSETNLANQQAADRQHAKYGIEPRCKIIASALTRRMARPLDPRLFFAFDSAVAEDVEQQARVFDMKLKNGSLEINEARAEDGYDPRPYGDEPWLSSSLRQPSEERPEPPAPPGAAGGSQEPAPDAAGGNGDAEAEDAEKALLGRLVKFLDAIEADRATPTPAGDRGGPGDPPGETRRAPAPRAREHVWAADGAADREGAEGVAGPSAQGDAGGDPQPAGDPGVVPEPDGLRRPDGDGDDPAPGGVLDGGGTGDVGEGGPGSGRVEGDQPPHGTEDPGTGPELLPVDQRDDEPPPGPGPGEAA